jgi:hypothetical protein
VQAVAGAVRGVHLGKDDRVCGRGQAGRPPLRGTELWRVQHPLVAASRGAATSAAA